MEREYIQKIIDGRCSKEEEAAFFQRVSCDKEFAHEYALIKNESVFSTLPNTVTDSELPVAAAKNKRTFWYYAVRVAAILSIPLAGYFAYNMIPSHKSLSEFETIKTVSSAGMNYHVNNGVRGKVVLPDSSVVWLNCGSTMDVPTAFDESQRVVSLSGEAYFEVRSDQSRPFYIKTPKNILVKVTGTEFNLSCYGSESKLTLTLVKGSVEMLRGDKERIYVKPKEEVVIDDASSKETNNRNANLGNATAWMSGRLVFEDAPMSEVITRMERWYGVHITVLDKNIYKGSFTADFKSESIIQVLELLKITSDITYEINGSEVVMK